MSSDSATLLPTQQSVKAYVDAEVAGIVDSAPGTLDTLNELAAALGDDANFSTTVTNSIATKAPLATPQFTNRVGIGVAAHGTAGLNITSTAQHMRLNNGSELGVISLESDGALRLWSHGDSNNEIQFYQGSGSGSASMTLDSSGNVGIGTNNPGGKLHVQTSHTATDVTLANSNETLVLGNSGTGNGVYNAIKFGGNQQDMYIMSFNNNQAASRRMGFFLGSVAGDAVADERLSILGNGNVGIGTTSPAAPLHVNGDVKADTLQLQDDSKMGFGTANAAASVGHTAAGPEGVFWHTDRNSYGVYRTTGAWSGDYSQLKLDWTTGIIIDGGSAYGKSGTRIIGDLICGTGTGYPHSASINSAYFHATGDTSQPACRLVQVSNSNSYPVIRMRHESTTAGRYIEFRTDENVLTGVIQDVSGTMQYQSASDSRLKENVESMSEGLTEVLAMNPVKFTWKDIVTENKTVDMEGAESRGFLAQELNEQYPWAVSEGGEDEKEKPWSVDYGKLTPVLVKAIQELKAELDAAKARITELEG
jgi:hypothetical protein